MSETTNLTVEEQNIRVLWKILQVAEGQTKKRGSNSGRPYTGIEQNTQHKDAGLT